MRVSNFNQYQQKQHMQAFLDEFQKDPFETVVDAAQKYQQRQHMQAFLDEFQ